MPVIVQMPGRFAWLDDDTLAITTFADANAKAPWMVRKIVAYDVPARRAACWCRAASSIARTPATTW